MIQIIRNCCFLSYISLFFLPLIGCGQPEPMQTPEIEIGVAVYRQDDTFISTVVQDMEQLAREEEVDSDLIINLRIVDGRGNQTVQLEQIDQFISLDYDVICVNIVDRTAAAVLIDKAKEANIPLIFFNRQPVEEDMERWDEVYYVGAQAESSGRLQGKIVQELWRADSTLLDKNGDNIIQYVMLEGEVGHQDTLLRTKYAIDSLTSVGIQVEKLAGDTANWSRGEASTKMSQWITELETPVEVVFANNDDMALGAIDAYLATGVEIADLPVVIGVDAHIAALEALEDGRLYGTVLNDSRGIAKSMLALSLALFKGENPAQAVTIVDDHYVWLEYEKVTLETLN